MVSTRVWCDSLKEWDPSHTKLFSYDILPPWQKGPCGSRPQETRVVHNQPASA